MGGGSGTDRGGSPQETDRGGSPQKDAPWTGSGRPWIAANEIVAFLIELAALATLAWWGFATGQGAATAVLLGVGTPLAAAVLWGLFAAPKARLRPPLAGVLLVKALVLLGACGALYALGSHLAAGVSALVVVANTTVAETTRRRGDAPVSP